MKNRTNKYAEVIEHYLQQAEVSLPRHNESIVKDLTGILFDKSTVRRSLHGAGFFKQNDINKMWSIKSELLIRFLKNLLDSNMLDLQTLNKLSLALHGFIVSRDYDVIGKYEQSSYLGFSLVKTNQAFKAFEKTLETFNNDLNREITKLNQKNIDSSSRLKISTIFHSAVNALSNLASSPIKTYMLFLIFTDMVSARELHEEKEVVAYLPFNTNARDETNHIKSDCVVHGARLAPDMFNKPNRAFYYDGNSYMTGSAKHFPGEDRTFEMYVNPDENSGGAVLGYGGDENFIGSSWNMIVNNKCKGASFEIVTFDEAKDSKYLVPSVSIPSNAWTFITVTMNRDTGTMVYFNGSLVSNSSLLVVNTYVKGSRFVLGAAADKNNGIPYTTADNCLTYFIGTIDQLKVYNFALSADKVRESYYESLIEPVPPVEPNIASKFFSGVGRNLNSFFREYYFQMGFGVLAGAVAHFGVIAYQHKIERDKDKERIASHQIPRP